MTVHYKTRGFVFKKEDRLDADRVFSVFTADFGKLDVFGKAIRKINSKLKGGMEIFYLCDIEFIQGKSKKTLTDALAIEKFKSISQDPEKYRIALGICQLVDDSLHGQEKDDRILHLLLEVFSRLDSGRARWLVYYYFFWHFIALLGYGPEISNGEMSQDVAVIVQLIMKKDWKALEQLSVSAPVQQSFRITFKRYYNQFMELHA